MSEVIVTDSGAENAEGEAVALAEGVLIGAAAVTAEQAQETAEVAEAEAEVAAAAAFDAAAAIAELRAVVIGIYDAVQEDIADLAGAIELLADETEAVAESEMTTALDQAELTEIVADATSEPEATEAESTNDAESSETAEAAETAADTAEPEQPRRRQHTGGLRFRRGRR